MLITYLRLSARGDALFSQDDFNDFVVDSGVIGLFDEPVKLKSGRMSCWYVNWRTVMEDAYLANCLIGQVHEFVWERLPNAQAFYGVPEGATKLALLAQMEWARSRGDFVAGSYSLSMGRGKPKEHGDLKDRFFLGVPKGNTVVLEDVTTTGGSLIESVKSLELVKAKVIAAVGLTDREEVRDDGGTVAQKLSEMGIMYYSMSRATELLPIVFARKKGLVPQRIRSEVEGYFDKYGAKKLVLK